MRQGDNTSPTSWNKPQPRISGCSNIRSETVNGTGTGRVGGQKQLRPFTGRRGVRQVRYSHQQQQQQQTFDANASPVTATTLFKQSGGVRSGGAAAASMSYAPPLTSWSSIASRTWGTAVSGGSTRSADDGGCPGGALLPPHVSSTELAVNLYGGEDRDARSRSPSRRV